MGSLRRRDVGRDIVDACLARGERVITAFWHAQLLEMPFVYPPHVAAILISQHRDGEYISRVTRRLGHPVVRGSATRGGLQAFRQMLQILEEGGHVAITPDGPRGPVRQVKPGVIELSRLSGMPILPVAFAAEPAWRLKSWDRFLLPYPFARAIYVWGEPIRIPRELSRADAEAYQLLLAERLDSLTAEAERQVSSGGARP
jgi:lysophospholipid acyltransferase (LPLAT)-like uncharacterized protein